MVLEFLPMHPGPMSSYTVCFIAAIVSTWLIFMAVYIRYNSNKLRGVENWAKDEIARTESSIRRHDVYITATSDVINNMKVDLEVQKSSMKDIKENISEIMKDIKILIKRERD